MSTVVTRFAIGWLAIALAAPGTGAQTPTPLPLKYSGPPTTAAITPGDLMTRIYLYADDSLMGRQVGTEWNIRSTAYIEREVRRLGLQPAGENGGYFQDLPMGVRALDSASRVVVDGSSGRAGRDFLASLPAGGSLQRDGVEVVFGGMAFDTTAVPAAEAWRGKLVVFTPFTPPPGFNQAAWVESAGGARFSAAVADAIPVVITGAELNQAAVRQAFGGNGNATFLRDADGQPSLAVTQAFARRLLGRDPAGATPGATGRSVDLDIRVTERRIAGGRNVIAILPGSDPALRHQYVAVGSHNDHIGFTRSPQDTDSIWAFNRVVRPQGADSPNRPASAVEARQIRATLDSLRRLRTPRRDSIRNGADDDASGAMGLLEIAEHFAALPERPRRSLLFVWHTGEEAGLWGADYFTTHPTVPRDSIVAQLNIDMIGRGGPEDITGSAKGGGLLHGDARYLQVIGSRRLSTELGDLIDEVNGTRPFSFRLDYAMDANGHPQNIYCRSDHYMYARFGIPIAFFTTGGHADYHQITDEPQYVRYDHAAEVTRFISDVALRVANAAGRPTVDKPVPDPARGCRQ